MAKVYIKYATKDWRESLCQTSDKQLCHFESGIKNTCSAPRHIRLICERTGKLFIKVYLKRVPCSKYHSCETDEGMECYCYDFSAEKCSEIIPGMLCKRDGYCLEEVPAPDELPTTSALDRARKLWHEWLHSPDIEFTSAEGEKQNSLAIESHNLYEQAISERDKEIVELLKKIIHEYGECKL